MAVLRGLLLAVLFVVAPALRPQGVLERSHVAVPQDELRAIEDARRGAKPRPFVQRKTPLGDRERERVRAFEAARASVVQVAASSQSYGSGVVWDSQGHVVTNYHLVSAGATPQGLPPILSQFFAIPAQAMDFTVRAQDGAEYSAKLVGAVPECDLALLKTDTPIKGAVPIRLGRSSELVVGRYVHALGNPYGYDQSLTSGIVSALDRVIGSPANTPISGMIQTDAAINRGSSGGPLLDTRGRMVGLNAALVSPSGWSAGLNYAIPSETVAAEIAKLLEEPKAIEPLPPMTKMEQARADVFNRAKDSIVAVHTKELYRNFWTGFESLNPTGSGSGVIWDSKGHVVTNFHVIAQSNLKAADVITIATRDGQETSARVVALRPDIDIAVLKLDQVPEGLKPIPVGSAAGLAVGQSVLALGNPFGNDHSLTAGVVSALNRTIESPTGSPIKGALQVDAAINPGNSGGPLLDMGGRMIGMNTMMFSASGVNANVGMAVPSDLIRREIETVTGPKELSQALLGSPEDQNGGAVFKRAKDAVVYVHAQTSKFDIDDVWTGNILRLRPTSGTGIVWDGLGHIVTAYRTVLMSDPLSGQMVEAEKLTVTLANGKTYSARIIGRSLTYQVAVLRVFAPFKDMRPLPLAGQAGLKVGQDIFALGNPFGMDHSLCAGVLSAGRDLSSKLRGVIQTDAAINPGNIGGPILDSDGNLVGMGFFMEGPNSHAGINFALSSATLNRIVPILLAKGQVERPALGFVSVAGPEAERYFGVKKGVLVDSVDNDSPASRAGLLGLRSVKAVLGTVGPRWEIGDVIIGLGGRQVEDSETLWDLLEQQPPSAPLSIDVLRDGKKIQVVLEPWK